ncbi:preprotein translocase subunit [Bifidobacterium lemurum]|uniref:Preprotein translocase subunit n=2 Tax=Bifidobacterium lemurum TaxID=1603886 RepID=A0A261FLE4_9BIFI|nr:preprotein translocase subunit [Bifidobacterium lemurum]
MGSSLFLIVIMVAMIGMMWWQSRKAKQQQAERQDFRANLQPGTEIITIGGVIGKVVSVDVQYEEIVIDSEGSLMRFSFNAISKEYVRPAYVSDDEVDENGNPIEQNDDEAQVPMDQALESAENAAETTETVEAKVVDTEVADEQPQEAAK